MPLQSAVPLCLSALSAPGDPAAAAARWKPGPAPSTTIGCDRHPQPRPTGRLAVTPRRAGLGGGGGSFKGFLSPSPFFLSPAALLVSLTLLCLFPAPPPKSWALSFSRLALLLTWCPSAPTHSQIGIFSGSCSLRLLLHCSVSFPSMTDLCPPKSWLLNTSQIPLQSKGRDGTNGWSRILQETRDSLSGKLIPLGVRA